MKDSLEKQKNYFKLTLPHTRNELKVAIWSSWTPEQYLLHIHNAIHAFTQMGLEADIKKAKVSLESVILDLDIKKSEYSSKKKEAKEPKEKPTPSSKAKSQVAVPKMTDKMP